MPNAVISPGTMTACRVSTQLSRDMSRYCGTMDSWVGTVMVSTTMTNSVLRPGKCSLAKANPASAQMNAWPTPITVAMTKLLISDCTNGTVSNTRPARWKKLPPGRTRGGRLVAAAESVVATTNIQ
jgi:hypothetical protein